MQFTLTSEEGLPLRGTLEIPGDAEALAILVGDTTFCTFLSDYLTAQRVAVAQFDLASTGNLKVVTRHAQSRADLPTFLLGCVDGAGVALTAAEDVAKLRGVIVWRPAANDDATRAASKLHVPLLVIYGGRDEKAHALANAAKDGMRVMIASAAQTFDPPQLQLAGAVTSRFISGYGE